MNRTHETVYLEGQSYFEAVFAAIESAKKRILIETYIYEQGLISKRLLEYLERALKRKVEIKILIDAVGSYGDTAKLASFCLRNHIELKIYHPILWLKIFKAHKFLNRRDHRKVFVIDDEFAFVGSLNLSDVHVKNNTGLKPWKDYGVSFKGDGVRELIDAFEKSTHSDDLVARLHREFIKPRKNNPDSGLLLNDGIFKRRECRRKLISRIRGAKNKIYLASAYILPEFKFQKQLEKAARRGVEVSLLTSGDKNDVFFMPWLARIYYKKCLKAGIKVYEYQPSFFMAKSLSSMIL